MFYHLTPMLNNLYVRIIAVNKKPGFFARNNPQFVFEFFMFYSFQPTFPQFWLTHFSSNCNNTVKAHRLELLE